MTAFAAHRRWDWRILLAPAVVLGFATKLAFGSPTDGGTSLWFIPEEGAPLKLSGDRSSVPGKGFLGVYQAGSAAFVIPNEYDKREQAQPKTVPPWQTRPLVAERKATIRVDPPLGKSDGPLSLQVFKISEPEAPVGRLLTALATADSREVRLIGLDRARYSLRLTAAFRVPLEMDLDVTVADQIRQVPWDPAAGVELKLPKNVAARVLEYRVGEQGRVHSAPITSVTAADGKLPMLWVKPGRRRVLEYHLKDAGRGRLNLDIPVRTIHKLTLEKALVWDVEVRALGPNGAPVAAFRVSPEDDLESQERSTPCPPPVMPRSLDATEGRLLLTDLPPGKYTFWASSAGLPVTKAAIELGKDRRSKIPLQLNFEQPRHFTIHLLNAPPEFALQILTVMYDRSGNPLGEQAASCDARFSCRVVVSPEAAFLKPALVSETLELQEINQPLSVELGEAFLTVRRLPLVSGEVVFDGRAVAGVQLAFKSDSGWVDSGVSDEVGRWRKHLLPGTWQVVGRESPGKTERRSQPKTLRLGPEETLSGIVLELLEGSLLKVRVVQSGTSAPVSGAELEKKERAAFATLAPATFFTDTEGYVTIPRGKEAFQLITRAPGYGTSQRTIDALPADPYDQELVIALAPEARLEVMTLDDFGSGKPGTQIQVSAGSGLSITRATNQQGVALFDGLPAGEVQVREVVRRWVPGVVMVSSGDPEVEVVLAPGETRRVTLGEPGIRITLEAQPRRIGLLQVRNREGLARTVSLDAAGIGQLTLAPGEEYAVLCLCGPSWTPLGTIRPEREGQRFGVVFPANGTAGQVVVVSVP